jgi:ATP adenylyltransferase
MRPVDTPPFEPGTLWTALLESTKHALGCGALHPIATEHAVVEGAGVAFEVHVLGAVVRKLAAGIMQAKSGDNPFLPYDDNLFVANASDSHVCLLNKFPILEQHLLLVTRDFEPQESALTPADFEALARCLEEFDSLGFYNGGRLAGASQPHKHLQIVPVPLGAGPERLPVDPLLERGALPFSHRAWRLDGLDAVGLHARYAEGMASLGLDAGGANTRPYNLLVTRDWLVLVPREQGLVEGIPVNALGYAGALLVLDEAQLEALRRRGPLDVLKQATLPPG